MSANAYYTTGVLSSSQDVSAASFPADSTPFYSAPNFDATFYPRYYDRQDSKVTSAYQSLASFATSHPNGQFSGQPDMQPDVIQASCPQSTLPYLSNGMPSSAAHPTPNGMQSNIPIYNWMKGKKFLTILTIVMLYLIYNHPSCMVWIFLLTSSPHVFCVLKIGSFTAQLTLGFFYYLVNILLCTGKEVVG